MKRRDFLAASALFSIFGLAQAQTAKKTAKKTTKQPAKKTVAKSKKPASPTTKSSTKPAAVKPEAAVAEPAPQVFRNTIPLIEDAPDKWRQYEIHTQISLANAVGGKLYLPLPFCGTSLWQRSLGMRWQGNFAETSIFRDPVSETELFCASWNKEVENPQCELVSRVMIQNRHFDFTRRSAVAENSDILRYCLRGTDAFPLDGIVEKTAERAIGRVKDPLAQAKALYDWVVEHVDYEEKANHPEVNMVERLDNGTPSGNSAAISQLFVALCRSVGIPARPVFGLRIDRSQLFASLGASGNLNSAFHCRAEFYSPGYGWIPVDPSDVRRTMVRESLFSGDSRLNVLKKLLFGFWEMNWVALNTAQEVVHPLLPKGLPRLDKPIILNADGELIRADSDLIKVNIQANAVFAE